MRRRAGRLALFCVAVLFALAPASAPAKDFKSMPSIEAGGRWLFAYQEGVQSVEIAPAAAYGLTYTQIIDFDWSRNVSFEANYLHSKNTGQMKDLKSGDWTYFELFEDAWCVNMGYFFTGRKFLPYISGGGGVMALKYQPERNYEKLWEQTGMLNLGGGLDYTLWEAEVSRALDRILIGARFRYEYVFINKIFDTSLTGLAVTGRLELRF